MGDGYREVETKYAVDQGFVLPELEALSGVATVSTPETVTLEAIYYDTDDLRLARRKITLRRREGGSDAGWHLKLPVKAGERDEFRRPLDADPGPTELGGRPGDEPGGSPTGQAPSDEPPAAAAGGVEAVRSTRRPPADLTELVLVHLRGAPLRPVARLVTTRAAWQLCDSADKELAEVVDDQVSAQTLGDTTVLSHWREVEVELVAGDRDLLDEVGRALTAAGAAPSPNGSKLAKVLGPALDEPRPLGKARPPAAPGHKTPAGEVLRGYVTAQFEAILAADPRVRLDEPEAVHKMRVACRRLRSTLRTYAPLFDAEAIADLDGELRDLAGSLSGARDSEVQIAYFGGRVDELPADLARGPVKDTIDEHLSTGQAAAREEALAMLRSERYLALVGRLADVAAAPLSGPAAKPAGKVLPKLVRTADRRLARKVAAAAAKPAGEDRDVVLHSARKQAKRLRYAAEAVAPVYGKDAVAFAAVAENVQELLGAHQDATVARGLLRDWGVQAQAAGEPTAFTLGLLLGLEECRARTAERDFFDYWPEVSHSRHRRWLS